MGKPQVGVVGYGVIGQRLADGVALQEDMELVGVVDVAPTLSTRALCESDMPYDLYVVEARQKAAFDAVGIPVTGGIVGQRVGGGSGQTRPPSDDRSSRSTSLYFTTSNGRIMSFSSCSRM
jgi:hypothetical protein